MRKPEDAQAHSVGPLAEEASGIAHAVLETVTDSVLLLGPDLRVCISRTQRSFEPFV